MTDLQPNPTISKKKIIFIVLGLIMNILLWIFSGTKQINDLKNQIKQIQQERDSLKFNIDSLQRGYKTFEYTDSVKHQELEQINKDLKQKDKDLSESLDKVKNLTNSIDSLNLKMKNDTTKRVGQDLLNSLKSKIK
jgi:chromosome segregation ATPase